MNSSRILTSIRLWLRRVWHALCYLNPLRLIRALRGLATLFVLRMSYEQDLARRTSEKVHGWNRWRRRDVGPSDPLPYLATDPDKCTGCRACELACSLVNTDTFNPRRARVRIYREEANGIDYPIVCKQCASDAPCLTACPTGACHRDDREFIVIDPDVCIACKACVLACPEVAVRPDPIAMVSIKCEMCDDVNPPCVVACETSAIYLVRPGD